MAGKGLKLGLIHSMLADLQRLIYDAEDAAASGSQEQTKELWEIRKTLSEVVTKLERIKV